MSYLTDRYREEAKAAKGKKDDSAVPGQMFDDVLNAMPMQRRSMLRGSFGASMAALFGTGVLAACGGGDDDPITPELKAKTLFWTLSARYPFLRSQSSNLWGGVGFDFVDQKVHFFEPLSRDKLRVLWLRANWDAIDLTSRRPKWRADAMIELRKGLDIFDASDGDDAVGPSRADGEADALVLRAAASGELAIGRDFAVAISPRAQIAFDPVLAFEEFTAGT